MGEWENGRGEMKVDVLHELEDELFKAREKLQEWEKDTTPNGMQKEWVNHYKSFVSGLERAIRRVSGVKVK